MFLAECIWESAGFTKKVEENPAPGAYSNPALVRPFIAEGDFASKLIDLPKAACDVHVRLHANNTCRDCARVMSIVLPLYL